LTVKADEKRAIARCAASMCPSGETIIINGGTTTFMMAEFLASRRLAIVTNSLIMAEHLVSRSSSDVIVPGGFIYREQNVILSPFDNDLTRHYFAKRMFMGAQALSSAGLLESDPALIQAERRLIAQASELIVLADSSKFNSSSSNLILCPLDEIDTVVTDSAITAAALQMLKSAGVKVIVVKP
jgi:DeoR family ulaG and ulaABCDEF operon transcriptional repressor